MISLRTLILFYTRQLRVQPLRELMAVLGVAAGVALLFTMEISNNSVIGSFEQITHAVAGRATLELAARSPQGFDEQASEAIEHVAGVEHAAPILEQRIVAVGPSGSRALTLVGADERLAELGGNLASQFQSAADSSRQGLMVLSEPIARAIGTAPGQMVAIKIGERTEHLSVAAAVPSSRIGALADSPVAAAPLPVVQSLADLPGRVTRILVETRPGREAEAERAISRRFGADLNVRAVDAEAHLLANAARPEGQLTALFSLISLVVGMVLAYNAILLASGERRRFVAHLTQLGAPDVAIVASLAFDAFVLGVAGCVIGLIAGDLISLYAYRAVPGYLTAAFPIGSERILDLHTVLIAIVAGMLAAFLAAALPAIGLMRRNTTGSGAASRLLSFDGRPRSSDAAVFGVGAALFLASTAVSLLVPAASVVALVTLVVGLVSCIPMTVRYLLTLARAASRHSSDPAARLALAELHASPTRSVALAATGAVAVFLMVSIGGAVADVQRAVRTGAEGVVANAEIWLNPGGAENIYSTEPFAYGQTQRRLQRLAVVRSVLPYRQSFLDLPDRRVWVIGVPSQAPSPILASQLVDGSLSAATRHLRAGGWATISQAMAAQRHLRLGERFSLPTPTGSSSFRLAATISNYGWLPGTIIVNGNDYARLWHTTQASQLGVVLEPGVSLSQGKLAVEKALPSGSALTVQTDAERQRQISAVLGSTLSRLNQTSTVVLIAAIFTVLAMMLSAVWQRRGRLDALISMGTSFGQLTRLVLYESGSVLLAGCVIGMLSGILGQALIDGWLHHTTGSPIRFSAAWQLGLRTVLIASAISTAVAVIAVLRTVSFQPAVSFSTE
jgi:putative ABC transport system permease protein